MRIVSAPQGRAAWYDRSPLTIHSFFYQSLGAHGESIRMLYTVPAGRVFLLAGGELTLHRDGVAISNPWASASITLNSASLAADHLSQVIVIVNVLGSRVSTVLGGGLFLSAGDILRGMTVDYSNGGAVAHALTFSGTEFDA